jgi:hypothetical protein
MQRAKISLRCGLNVLRIMKIVKKVAEIVLRWQGSVRHHQVLVVSHSTVTFKFPRELQVPLNQIGRMEIPFRSMQFRLTSRNFQIISLLWHSIQGRLIVVTNRYSQP